MNLPGDFCSCPILLGCGSVNMAIYVFPSLATVLFFAVKGSIDYGAWNRFGKWGNLIVP